MVTCKIELIQQHFSRQNKNVTRMNYKAFKISLYIVFVESASIRGVATPWRWASIKISRDVYGLCTVWENGSRPPQKCTPTPLNLGGGGTCIGWLSHCWLFRTTTTTGTSAAAATAGAYALLVCIFAGGGGRLKFVPYRRRCIISRWYDKKFL